MPSRCNAELKKSIISLCRCAGKHGVTQKRYCELIRLQPRRLQRWIRRENLADGQPGYLPGTAPHKILTSEKAKILEYALNEEYADMSHRVLAYTAMDIGDLVVSPSTMYRVMYEHNLTGHRGIFRPHTGGGTPPEREELDGPLQRLCWDISFLRTHEKWNFLFLYALLDEWSRKILGWCIDYRESQDVAMQMLDEVFMREGILDMDPADRPVIINDRGPQMKAKTITQMFADLEIDQRFARPHTPNDNPYQESFFRTIKYHPDYPGKFRNREEAEAYFERFFPWYNTEHLHSGIGYITPHDKHEGRADKIFLQREQAKKQARQRRLNANRGLQNCQRTNEKTAFKAETQELCVALGQT